MNNELRNELEKVVKEYKKENKGYHIYQLEVEKVDGHNLGTMADIIKSSLPKVEKRTIIDSMTIRIQPHHWE